MIIFANEIRIWTKNYESEEHFEVPASGNDT